MADQTDKETRTNRVVVTLSDEELKKVEAAANYRGLSPALFMRFLAIDHVNTHAAEIGLK